MGAEPHSLLYPQMTRIFLTIASLSVILLVAALMLGLSMGDLHAQPEPSLETLHQATLHRLTGLLAALGVVFVECVVVTYFIGTSRWCREVVETYRLEPGIVAASNRLKRRTFPWSLIGVFGVLGVAMLGAAADTRATLRLDSQGWAYWHLFGSVAGIVLVVWTYLVAWNNILANHAIIDQVVADVARRRQERGGSCNVSSGQFPSQPAAGTPKATG